MVLDQFAYTLPGILVLTFFPLELAPSWMEPVSVLVPSTYRGDALRQVMVGATPQFSLAVDLAALAGFLVVLSVAAVHLFRWE